MLNMYTFNVSIIILLGTTTFIGICGGASMETGKMSSLLADTVGHFMEKLRDEPQQADQINQGNSYN